MAERLRVVLEFKKNDLEEVDLYERLLAFSNPGSMVKDILKGLIPLSVLEGFEDEDE